MRRRRSFLRTPTRNPAWQMATFFFEDFLTSESGNLQNLSIELARIDEHLGDSSAMGVVMTNIARSIDISMIVWNAIYMIDIYTAVSDSREQNYVWHGLAVDRLDQTGTPTGLTLYNPFINSTPVTTLLASAPQDEETPTRLLWSTVAALPVGALNETDNNTSIDNPQQRDGRHRLPVKLRIDDEHGLYYQFSYFNANTSASSRLRVILQGQYYYRVRFGR